MLRRLRAVYELEDINHTQIDGRFIREELTPVRKTDQTAYKIYKILDKGLRRGIRKYLVRWRCYSMDIKSWVLATCVRNV